MKVTVLNWGPIKNIENFSINKFTIFIGEQASGKSTMLKICILPQIVVSAVFDEIIESFTLLGKLMPTDEIIRSASRSICDELCDYFGRPEMFDDSSALSYSFNKGRLCFKITLDQANDGDRGSFRISFNENFHNFFNDSINGLRDYLQAAGAMKEESFLDNAEFILFDYIIDIKRRISDSLELGPEYFYIPEGRASIELSGQSNNGDFLLKSKYLQVVKRMSSPRRKVILTRRPTRDNATFYYSRAQRLSMNILKGKMAIDRKSKVILRLNGSKKDYPLELLSSGQQESFWPLNLILNWIKRDRSPISLYFEEPECHLYPSAQKSLVQIITLFANYSESNVILTTHSPFILSSLNILIKAASVKDKLTDDIKFITKLECVDPNKISVYEISNGELVSIMENGLINTFAIDRVSDKFDEEYIKLENLAE